MKNLLSLAVNGGDLWRLNYNRPFAARTQLVELMTLSQTSESDEEGILPPHSPPLFSGPHSYRGIVTSSFTNQQRYQYHKQLLA